MENGAGYPLMLDTNCSWTPAQTLEMAKQLEPYDLAWLEEPIRPDDPAALAEIRRAASMPIAAAAWRVASSIAATSASEGRLRNAELGAESTSARTAIAIESRPRSPRNSRLRW